MSAPVPVQAMVLAAGLGTRMRPLTLTRPKPLVEVGGRMLLDRGLDVLAASGVRRCVVNVHHLPGLVVDHLAGRTDLDIEISDERDRLLDSAGGVVKALPLLADAPFVIINADTFWLDGDRPALAALAGAYDPSRCDMVLLLADEARATGHSGRLDFAMGKDGRIVRASSAEAEGKPAYIYAGAAITSPSIFAGASAEPHSLNLYFDRAIAADRLFGTVLDGHWITVGTPDAIAPAEAAIDAHGRDDRRR